MAKRNIRINNADIRIKEVDEMDYICLSDMVSDLDGGTGLIEKWLRNKNTIEFLGIWERLYNEEFNEEAYLELFHEAGTNRFMLSVKKWVAATTAKGIYAKAGRYGGTFAHKDIAVQFASWLSPAFYLYLVREFQRLKEDEAKRLDSDWQVRRIMTKANYRIHTEAVREHLIPPRIQYTRQEGPYFMNEADMLNVALFGITAKEWRQKNPNKKGNMRDFATPEQLLVLSNLQSLNAKLLKWGCEEEQRLQILNESAIEEMQILVGSGSLGQLPGKTKELR